MAGMTRRPVENADGITVHGTFPLAVVYVDVSTRESRKNLTFFLRKLGLNANELQTTVTRGDGSPLEVAYDVWGGIDGLEQFLNLPIVRTWHASAPCRVGQAGSGGGEKRPYRPSDVAREVQRTEDRRAKDACAVRDAGRGDGMRRDALGM